MSPCSSTHRGRRCSSFAKGVPGADPRLGRRSRIRSILRRSHWSHLCSACCSSRSSRSVASLCSRSGACVRSGCSSRPAPRTATFVSSISANGTVVGLVGAVLGFVLGLVVWLAVPAEARAELAPRHRGARTLLDGGDRRHGACGRCGLLRGVPARAGDHQGADRPGALGSAGASSSDPPVRPPRHRLSRPRVPVARATPAARIMETGAVGHLSSSSGSSSSSPD